MVTAAVKDFALFVHDVVVIDDAFALIKIKAFDFGLGGFDGPVNHARLERLFFRNFEKIHELADLFAAKNAHDVVFEGNIKAGGTGIPLATGAAAELIIDAPAFVTDGADDMQAAELDDFVVEALPVLFFHLGRVATKNNVDTPAGDVRRDGDRFLLTGAGNDFGFGLVILGIQNLVRNFLCFKYLLTTSFCSIDLVPMRMGWPNLYFSSISVVRAEYLARWVL